MADWRVVEYTGRSLVRLLQRRFDETITPAGTVGVQLASPVSFDNVPNAPRAMVTLFLFRISEHTEVRNSPRRVQPDGTVLRQPLALELNYLITAWGRRPNDQLDTEREAVLSEHRLLGVVMQALYEYGELGNADLVDDDPPSVWAPEDQLQIVKTSLTVDDYYRIWDTSELPYRLSVAYQVRVLGLDESRATGAGRVVDGTFRTGRLLGDGR